ncbi:hypothetical protein ACFX2B_044131 [Malus domestica]
MDNLIDSSKDIDLLCERGILVNWLSSEDAAQFFNELWREKLRREHFGTPWGIISLVAAFVLLVLTMLQTVYTIHQYYHPSF